MALCNNMEEAEKTVSCVITGDGLSRESTIKVSLERLKEILCNPEIKDLPIIVYSIIGITRSGKSFFFNLLIKYLEEKQEEFLETGTVPDDKGFPWGHGCSSVTKGIWIWPKIYKLRKKNNDKVGIMLVDCEGMFESSIVEAQCKILVTVSSIISSTILYNIKGICSTDHLENIIRYPVVGCTNMEDVVDNTVDLKNTELIFLLRDWQDDSFERGFDGGRDYLNTKMENEIEAVHWQHIKECFGSIKCCLLPHPSKAVTKSSYNGDVKALDEDFRDAVKSFVGDVFSPQTLSSATKPQCASNIYKLLEGVNGMKIDDKGFSFINVYVSLVNRAAINSAIAEVKCQLATRGLLHHKEILDTAKRNFPKHVRGTDELKNGAMNEMLKEIEQLLQEQLVTSVVETYKRFLIVSENVMNEDQNSMIIEVLTLGLQDDAPFPQEAIKGFHQIAMPLYYGRQKTVIVEACDTYHSAVQSLDDLIRFKAECITQYRICAAFEGSFQTYRSEKLNLLDDLEERLSEYALTLAEKEYDEVMKAEVIDSLLPMFKDSLNESQLKTKQSIIKKAGKLFTCLEYINNIEMALQGRHQFYENYNTSRISDVTSISTATAVSAGVMAVAVHAMMWLMKSFK